MSATKCNYCSGSPYYNWEDDIPVSTLKNYFSEKYGTIGKITGISFSKFHGRVTEAVVRHDAGMIKMSGNDFRLALPEKLLKSMNFDAKKNGKMIHFSGHGWGHGVGMCQYGARGMALQKKSYHEILSYYYKGISFVKINDGR